MKFSARVYAKFLILLIILNIIDTGGTLYWISEGIATEANPIMQNWLQMNAWAFVIVKIVLVFACALCLWKFRRRLLANILIVPVVLVYFYVFAIHCHIAWLSFVQG